MLIFICLCISYFNFLQQNESQQNLTGDFDLSSYIIYLSAISIKKLNKRSSRFLAFSRNSKVFSLEKEHKQIKITI